MATGIKVDPHFLIGGKPASAQEVLNTLKPAVPNWFFAAFKVERGRIVLRDVKRTSRAERDDPAFKNWEQVYLSIRDASYAGEWRLMSAVTVDKTGEGEGATSTLRVDYPTGGKRILRGG